MTKQQKDLEQARKKAVKWLNEFSRLASQVAPNIDLGQYLDTYPDTLSEQMDEPDFVEKFKPHKRKVEVWVARPYVVEVEAVGDDEDAIEEAVENFHLYESSVVESPNAMHTSLVENVLSNHPYRATILHDFS